MRPVKPYTKTGSDCPLKRAQSILLSGAAAPALAQTELGSEDDFTVLGTDGTAPDPDVEIKGFTVFGSTQDAYTGAVVGPGGVVVNGVLAVSSGAYFVGSSTFTGAGKIFINDGSPGQLLRRSAAGSLEWSDASALGDNLGDHTATTQLNMGNYAIYSSSDITAARYQINGSTVLAILPGSGSLAAGPNSGGSNRGNYNIFVGSGAGHSNTTGSDNLFAGYKSGYANIGGDYNVFLGANAGTANATGGGNFFGGNQAGYRNTGGFANVFIGDNAGGHNLTGYSNVYIGKYAGDTNTASSNNIYIGFGAGGYNKTGNDNIVLGYEAGAYGNLGDDNVIIGREAGSLISSSENTVIGHHAALFTRAGGSNTVVGAYAGYGANGYSYAGNTLVGWRAGYALRTGANNVLIGDKAGDSLTTGAGNIIIGHDQDAPTPATNDYINIGGLLHGDMAQSSMTVYGDLYAGKFYGDGSALTGVSGSDNLGDHIATADLEMSAKSVLSVASMTMVGKGLQIGTDLTSSAYGIFISSYGSIMTIGAGHPGSVAPGARGVGAVDLQTYRTNASSVAAGDYSVVAGGWSNTASGGGATVSGGWRNTASASDATVSGGWRNTASRWDATVSGGWDNVASGGGSTVSGGGNNTAGLDYDTVSGGRYNTAGGWGSTVSGGYLNVASGDGSGTVSGGYENMTSGWAATVSGGSLNTASGALSTVSGGGENTALGDYSWAAGRRSSSTADGSFTWSDSQQVTTLNDVADRTWFKNRGGFLVTGSTQPFTDGAFYVDGKGAAQISKRLTQAENTGITLTKADFGKTITVDSGSAQIINLPAITAADIGASITVVKLGAGKVTIKAAASTYIADSAAAGTLYNNAVTPPYASVTLRLVTSTRWMLISGYGSWITTN